MVESLLYSVNKYLSNNVSGSVVLIPHSQSLLDLLFPLYSHSRQQPKFRPSGILPPLSSTTRIPRSAAASLCIKSTHLGSYQGLSSIHFCPKVHLLLFLIITTRNYGLESLPSLSYILVITTSGFCLCLSTLAFVKAFYT